MTDEFFRWFQFGTLCCWGTLGIGRALMLYAQGVKVLAVDKNRTFRQMIIDSAGGICMLIIVYEIVAFGWPLSFHIAPPILRVELVDALAIKISGAFILFSALLIYVLALCGLGRSWRLGIDRIAPGPLMTHGIYGLCRHPIYVTFDLYFAGTFLTMGNAVFLLFALMMFFFLHVHLLREERFLTQEYGDCYRNYCAQVKRYVFW